MSRRHPLLRLLWLSGALAMLWTTKDPRALFAAALGLTISADSLRGTVALFPWLLGAFLSPFLFFTNHFGVTPLFGTGPANPLTIETAMFSLSEACRWIGVCQWLRLAGALFDASAADETLSRLSPGLAVFLRSILRSIRFFLDRVRNRAGARKAAGCRGTVLTCVMPSAEEAYGRWVSVRSRMRARGDGLARRSAFRFMSWRPRDTRALALTLAVFAAAFALDGTGAVKAAFDPVVSMTRMGWPVAASMLSRFFAGALPVLKIK